jgi:catechol 2,3-dioxygenase-like lactoylglutathione lyase family enzyme
MSTEAATAVVKFHLSLNVADLARGVEFYRVLFAAEPAKVRPDYAKFELDEPPVVLSLIPTPHGRGGTLNHVGIRVLDSAALVGRQARLEAAGFKTVREEGVECCYSKQTKFWVNDPDGTLWELYVLHAEADDDHGPSCETGVAGDSAFSASGLALPVLNDAPAKPSAVWQHLLIHPLPERIDAGDASLDQVQLEGTLNMQLDDDRLRRFLCEVRRVLRPGGTVLAHALTSDRLLAERPQLPGPAALVEQVRPADEVLRLFASVGFTSVRFTKHAERPCFTVGEVQLRETKLAATNPATPCCG